MLLPWVVPPRRMWRVSVVGDAYRRPAGRCPDGTHRRVEWGRATLRATGAAAARLAAGTIRFRRDAAARGAEPPPPHPTTQRRTRHVDIVEYRRRHGCPTHRRRSRRRPD